MQHAVFTAMHLLDSDLRREYEQAVGTVPHLVAMETKAMDFLRTDGFDVTKAATRLAYYWKYRKWLFNERWLLPMKQTGTGCLDMDDIEILRSGVLVYIPRQNQGPLMLVDRSRLPRTGGYSACRMLFYVMTVMTDKWLQTEGATAIKVVSSDYANKSPEMSLDKEIIQIPVKALPMRLKNLMVAQSYEFGKEILVDTLAYNEWKQYEFQFGFGPERIARDSVGGVLEAMQRKGVDFDHIPQCLGGIFDISHYSASWVRMRMSMEDVMSSVPVMANHLPANQVVLAAAPSLPTTAAAAAATWQQQANYERQDKHDSYPQSMSTVTAATATTTTAITTSAAAAAAASTTSIALAVPRIPARTPAASVVTCDTTAPHHGGNKEEEEDFSVKPKRRPGETAEAFQARRNAFYYRRCCRKTNDTLSALQNQKRELERCNQTIKADNVRLEGLLAKSRYLAALVENGIML